MLKLLYPCEAVHFLPPDWQKIVKSRSIYELDANREPIPNPDNIRIETTLQFKWQGDKAPFCFELSRNSNFDDIFCSFSDLAERHACVDHLPTFCTLYWRVTDADGVVKTGIVTIADEPRIITMPDSDASPVNVRDIGGYKSKFGGHVRQSMVYRGSDFSSFLTSSEENLDFLRNTLHITTELDLRYNSQVVGITQSAISPDVKWLHFPILIYNDAFDIDSNSFKKDNMELIRQTMACFADKSLYPIYMHCAGGADRTGVIAFLLNALLGVSEEDLYTDYELTSLTVMPRPISIDYMQKWLNKLKEYAAPDSPISVQVEAFLKGIGMTDRQLNDIKAILIAQ